MLSLMFISLRLLIPLEGAAGSPIPFQSVERSALEPGERWGSLKAPYPTGAWFSNLAVGRGDQIFVALPYQFRLAGTEETDDSYEPTAPMESFGGGLQVSYGTQRRTFDEDSVIDWFGVDLVLGATDTADSVTVTRYDSLTLDLEFATASSSFSALLARGSPFVTMAYKGAKPSISSPVALDALSDVDTSSEGMTVYQADYADGQSWLIVLEGQGVELRAGDGAITASAAFTGVLRIARVPSASSDPLLEVDTATATDALLRHAAVFPVSASITWTTSQLPMASNSAASDDDGSSAAPATTATYRFEWKTQSFGRSEDGEGGDDGGLLMLALPHHVETLVNGISTATEGSATLLTDGDLAYLTLKGVAQGVVGSTWEMEEPLSTIGFFAPKALEDCPASWVEAVASALEEDMTVEASGTNPEGDLIDPKWIDPYGFGKAVARVARLALVAEELGEADQEQAALDAVERALSPWFEGTNDDALVYDKTWGGIISSDGVQSAMADFGNGWYNDHHFHYGYIIYAAAVVCRKNPDFAKNFDGAIRAIIGDIAAQPPLSDSDVGKDGAVAGSSMDSMRNLFPTARHKDFYDGHSWASGVFPMVNGKSQESVSEAVNAYYAIHLFGLAVKDQRLSEWGRLLLALELRAAHWYWQMPKDQSVYPSNFTRTKMVGVVGSSDAKVWTWFGTNPEYVHGINMMPFTPITESLLPYHYTEEEFTFAKHRLNDESLTDQWRGILELAHAIIDPNAAFAAVLPLQKNKIDGFDAGNSLTNSLYWIATRPNASAH